MFGRFLILLFLACCLPNKNANAQVDVNEMQNALSSMTTHVNVPPTDFTGKVNISIALTFVAMSSVDERKNTVSLSAAVFISWGLPESAFNSNASVNLREGNFAVARGQDNMWTPKIVPANCLNLNAWRDSQEKAPVNVYPGGVAEWFLFSPFDLSCKLDLVNYPFDTQICSFMFGSVAEKSLLTYKIPGRPFACVMQSVLNNPQWEFLGTSYLNNEDLSLDVRFAIRRRSSFYVISILLPILLLSLSGFAVFVSPAHSEEKMNIACTVMLSFFMMFASVCNSMPAVSDIELVPLLYWLLFSLFCAMAAASIYAAVLLRVSDYAENSFKYGPSKKKNRVADADTASAAVKVVELSDEEEHSRLKRRVNIANNVGVVLYAIGVLTICTIALVRYYKYTVKRQPTDYFSKVVQDYGNATFHGFSLDGTIFYSPNGGAIACSQASYINSNNHAV